MRSTYFGLATAALCWTGALASLPADNGIPNEALLARRPRVIQNRHRNATAAAAELAQLVGRQDGGRCGAGVGRCPEGQCCSDYGFCGLTVDHCHPLFDCQAEYGVCGWPPPEPPRTTSSSTPPVVIPSSTSTPPVIIPSSTTTPPVVSSTSQPPVVQPSSTTSVIPQPSGTLVITSNGRCGNNTICVGNPSYGPCCSNHFWCGSSLEYCGAGCQSQFGACLGVPGLPGGPINNGTSSSVPVVVPSSTSSPPVVIPSSTSSPPVVISSSTSTPPVIPSSTSRTSSPVIPSSTSRTSSAAPSPSIVLPPGQRTSTDGRCGNGQNCLGSTFGRCCSQFGWCGDGDQFCPYIVGCQTEFGYCDPA